MTNRCVCPSCNKAACPGCEPQERRDPLMNLADFMVEEIMSMSDEEILAEVSPEEVAETRRRMLKFLDSLAPGECAANPKEG